MNRRTFLKSIAMIGVAACVPPALVPAWKHGERDHVLRYNGIPIIYDEACAANTVYFLNPQSGVWRIVGSRGSIEQLSQRALMT